MASCLRKGLGERVLGRINRLYPVFRRFSSKKIVVKIELDASLVKVRAYLQQVQRFLTEDERFRSLLVYYDVDPM